MTMTSNSSDVLRLFSNGMADAVERVAGSLVLVNGRQRQPATGIVFAPGLVLTADHVLEREDDLTIQTADKRNLAAQFVGRDPTTDIAVLRVADLNVNPATAASEQARVGQFVLNVGRPSPEGHMASAGIVSVYGGPLRTNRGILLEKYIQTDAIPYPGFSGGALISTEGEVVGLITTGLLNSISLAVPAEIAWRIANTLAQNGVIKRGFLGISSQPVQLPQNQRAGQSQETGLLVVRVENGSPAERGGFLMGDILVALDGQSVTDTDELHSLLSGERVGKSVSATVIRAGGLQTLNVTVGQRT